MFAGMKNVLMPTGILIKIPQMIMKMKEKLIWLQLSQICVSKDL